MNRLSHISGLDIGGFSGGFTNLTNIIIDAAGEKIGCRFYPQYYNDVVTAVDMFVTVVGDCSGITFTLQIEGDTAGEPDGVAIGAATAAFAGPNVSGGAQQWLGGGTNPINLGASASLTINTPYWLVLSIASGTPDGTHSLQLRGSYTAQYIGNGTRVRHHNGTNWTTTTSVASFANYIIKYNSGKLQGFSYCVAMARSAQNDIYVNSGSNQVQGLRIKLACKALISSVIVRATKTGTPNDLVCTIYEENTQKQTQSFDDALFTTAYSHQIVFQTPVVLNANKNINIVFSQTGTSDSNDWDIYTSVIPANYMSLMFTSGQGFIYGVLANPNDLTLSTTEFPFITPYVKYVDSELTSNFNSFINMNGGLIG